VAPTAEWCGQCFAPIRRDPVVPDRPAPSEPARPAGPTSPVAVATPGGGALEVAGGTATWDCPVCGGRNPIEAVACEVCRAPFARLFERPEERPAVDATSAVLWSLAFAGLGHWRAGLRADGVARAVVFAWTLGTVILILMSRSDAGFGSSLALFCLYAGSAGAIYVLSAIDAHRVASDLPQLVPSRVLLWCSAGLVLLSLVLSVFVTLPATRG
jgi:hypothetical protein